MKFINKISSLLTLCKKSEFPTSPKAGDFGYAEEDRFALTRGPHTSGLTISWKDLVKYLALHGIEHGGRKFGEVLGGSTFVSDGYLVSVRKGELPA
ncbi:hypothetical protein [Pseudomonas sp. PLMAX]|uniref:hypothetical protein n=1 Tax=Pseudomonas sp. PLMAX TaxID=2201998 RepID=UPI0038BBF2AE